jgi:hypothetical protein
MVAPANGQNLWGASSTLIWYPSTDPNPGDTVTYGLQVDDDPAFGSPEVSESGIDENHAWAPPDPDATTIAVTLGSLTGFGNLVNNTVYYWRLRAADDRGAASAWTSESRYFLYGTDAQAPVVAWASPPEGAALSSSPVMFAGTAADDFAGLDYVQWSADGGATWNLTTGAGSWNFSFFPQQNGALQVLVRAADKAGNLSIPSPRNFTVALPDIPVALQAWPDNSAVLLIWQAPSAPGVEGYHLYRSTASRTGYVKVTGAPVAGLAYTDRGLTNGVAYYYAVRAVYGGVEKGYSDEAWAVPMATGRPPFVGDLRVAKSGGDLVLSWSPLTVDTGGGAYACPHYEIYAGSDPAFIPDILGNANRLALVAAPEHTMVGGATGSDPLFLHVTAADAMGVEGLWTQWRREEDGAETAATPDWARTAAPDASGGAHIVSATVDGTVTLAFSGTAVSVGAMRGPDQGIAAVAIDGIPAGMVDLYAAVRQWRAWVFHADGLADGPHTLVYRVTGTANGASTGVSVNLDAYLFGRR